MDLTLHTGKIREYLSSRDYHISPLGIIRENNEDKYSLGDIRFTHGIRKLFVGKEEVIVSKEIGKGKARLIQMLKYDNIPFREAKIKRIKRRLIAQEMLLADQD
jgi:hypothetical protein